MGNKTEEIDQKYGGLFRTEEFTAKNLPADDQDSRIVDGGGSLFCVYTYAGCGTYTAKKVIRIAEEAGYSVVRTVEHDGVIGCWILENKTLEVRFLVMQVLWVPTDDPIAKVRWFLKTAAAKLRMKRSGKSGDKTL